MRILRRTGGLRTGYPIYGVSTPLPDVPSSQTLPHRPIAPAPVNGANLANRAFRTGRAGRPVQTAPPGASRVGPFGRELEIVASLLYSAAQTSQRRSAILASLRHDDVAAASSCRPDFRPHRVARRR